MRVQALLIAMDFDTRFADARGQASDDCSGVHCCAPIGQPFLIEKAFCCVSHPESLSLGHLRPDVQLLRHVHNKHVDDAFDWRSVHLVWLAHVPEFAKHGRLHQHSLFSQLSLMVLATANVHEYGKQ